MKIIAIIISGSIGLCLGSFVDLMVHRYSPTQKTSQYLYSIIFERSYCPKCGSKLTISSLIPIISWLIQRGKCRYCKVIIGKHYLMTELFLACITILIINELGVYLWSISLILLATIFITLIIIDYYYLRLPNCFVYLILIFGLINAGFEVSHLDLLDALLGILVGLLLLWLPAKFYYLLTNRIGLGGGDIKLLAALGTWIEYYQLPLLLIIASMLGLMHFIMIQYSWKTNIKIHKINQSIVIPFGPYLLIAGYSLLLYN